MATQSMFALGFPSRPMRLATGPVGGTADAWPMSRLPTEPTPLGLFASQQGTGFLSVDAAGCCGYGNLLRGIYGAALLARVVNRTFVREDRWASAFAPPVGNDASWVTMRERLASSIGDGMRLGKGKSRRPGFEPAIQKEQRLCDELVASDATYVRVGAKRGVLLWKAAANMVKSATATAEARRAALESSSQHH